MDKEPTNKSGEVPVGNPWDSLMDESFQGKRKVKVRLRRIHQEPKESGAQEPHNGETTNTETESAAREELETQERERIEQFKTIQL